MGLHPNVRTLRDAKIPDYTHTTTLVREGEHALAVKVGGKEFIDDKGRLRNYYMTPRNPSREAMRKTVYITALFAKEMRLSGIPICYVNLAGLVREASYEGVERRVSTHPVMERMSKNGYIVIPDFTEYADARTVYPAHALRNIADYLATHVIDGGGLVLGGLRPTDETMDVFGAQFATLIEQRFEYYVIQQG